MTAPSDAALVNRINRVWRNGNEVEQRQRECGSLFDTWFSLERGARYIPELVAQLGVNTSRDMLIASTTSFSSGSRQGGGNGTAGRSPAIAPQRLLRPPAERAFAPPDRHTVSRHNTGWKLRREAPPTPAPTGLAGRVLDTFASSAAASVPAIRSETLESSVIAPRSQLAPRRAADEPNCARLERRGSESHGALSLRSSLHPRDPVASAAVLFQCRHTNIGHWLHEDFWSFYALMLRSGREHVFYAQSEAGCARWGDELLKTLCIQHEWAITRLAVGDKEHCAKTPLLVPRHLKLQPRAFVPLHFAIPTLRRAALWRYFSDHLQRHLPQQ